MGQLLGIGTLASFAGTRRRAVQGRLLLGGKEVARSNTVSIGKHLEKPDEFAPSFQMLPQLRSMPALDRLGPGIHRLLHLRCLAFDFATRRLHCPFHLLLRGALRLWHGMGRSGCSCDGGGGCDGGSGGLCL